VEFVLSPEVRVKRLAMARVGPKLFGIGKKDFEEWKGFG
jgi:hypothetical protein